MAPTKRERLAHSFRQQAEFAQDYAPLYARIFRTVAGWLAAPELNPVATWLVAASRQRQSFAVTNLLLGGLHREVLANSLVASPIRAYYPTVGGTQQPGLEFEARLQRTIWEARERLAPFIATANVQTNETIRGLIWWLPLHLLPWPAVHVVDVGASAGLNLLAPERLFSLVDEAGHERLRLGMGAAGAMRSQVTGTLTPLAHIDAGNGPRVLSRLGIDGAPFWLEDDEAVRTLMAFVWADHPERLERLKQALVVYEKARQSPTPLHLQPVTLPDGLAPFLEGAHFADENPLVLYNTIVKPYLPAKGAVLENIIAAYARTSGRPVLWCQLEPAEKEPYRDWFAWTVHFWHGDQTNQWQIAWAHPHLTDIQFLSGFEMMDRWWSRS